MTDSSVGGADWVDGVEVMTSVFSMLGFRKEKKDIATSHSGILDCRGVTSGPER